MKLILEEKHKISKQQKAKLKQKMLVFSMLRLIIFLSIVYGIYLSWGNWQWILGCILGGGVIFTVLVKLFANTQFEKKRVEQKIKWIEEEIKSINGDYSFRPTGETYKEPNHLYANDLDLFGEKSLFQYLNRTQLKESEALLANLLTANDIEEIHEKQEAIKELAKLNDFRLAYTTDAALIETELKSNVLIQWMKSFQAYIPTFFKWFAHLFSFISVVLITSYFIGFVSGYLVLLWFFVGLGISGRFLKKTNQLSAHLDKAQGLFEQYHYLISHIENTNFSSKLLQQKKNRFTPENGKKASQTFHKFAKIIDALDQRNNFLLGVFLNAFFLWDIRQSLKIQEWIGEHNSKVEAWMNQLFWIDAYNSLGNFAALHPHFTFPSIEVNQDKLILSKEATHPLISPEKAVSNSFEIQTNEFFIVTGANMAGKSTFLRTLGLQLIMANMGLPVASKSCSYRPIKLISSMRTNDSLADDSSYFFAELTRLKMIVDTIQQDEYFIILDEILKGTNSTDKAIGSKQFIEKLIRLNSTGVIATHDLSLCELEKKHEEISNHYFDATIENNELYFDYRMKKGICQNMNASFLLKKMNIVD